MINPTDLQVTKLIEAGQSHKLFYYSFQKRV